MLCILLYLRQLFLLFSIPPLCFVYEFGSRCVCETCCCGFETALLTPDLGSQGGARGQEKRPLGPRSSESFIFFGGGGDCAVLTLVYGFFGIEYFPLAIKTDCTLCLDTFGYFFFHVL